MASQGLRNRLPSVPGPQIGPRARYRRCGLTTTAAAQLQRPGGTNGDVRCHPSRGGRGGGARRREWTRALDGAGRAAGAGLPGAAPRRRARRRCRAPRGQERVDRLLPAREPRRGGLRHTRARALPRTAPAVARPARRPPRARGRRRRPLPAHAQALLPRHRARGHDRDHGRARSPGHRPHARPRVRRSPTTRTRWRWARSSSPACARRRWRATSRAAWRATRRTRSPRATSSPTSSPGARGRLRGRPRGVRRGLLLYRGAGARRARPAGRGPRACRRRRARSTPSTTSSRRPCARSPRRPAPARFQHRAETDEFLVGADTNTRPSIIASPPRSGGRYLCVNTTEVETVSRASITKAHNKIQELSWDPTYVTPVEKYATDYTFEKAPKKDPAEAGPALLLPDGGREGQPRLRRDGRRDPREHVPPGPGALDGVAEAVPLDHPVPGDLRRRAPCR